MSEVAIVYRNHLIGEPDTGVDPFFSDDFEAGDLSKSGGSRNFDWNGSVRCDVTTLHPHSGSYSLQFSFQAGGETSDAWAEQRFSYDAITNGSEIWVEYYTYYPDGTEGDLGPAYYNRDMIGSSDGHKIIRIWGGDYGSGNHFTCGWSAETGTHEDGSDRIGPTWRRDDGVLMSAGASGLINGLPGVDGTPTGNMVRGAWMQIRNHFQPASGIDQDDGRIRLWIDGVLKKDLQNIGFYHKDGSAYAYFDQGYLMGWSNAGFDEETYVFIDDIKFYDTDPGWV